MHAIEFEGSIPVTSKRITVVLGDYDGITICDYIHGQPVDQSIYVSSADFDDAILTYPYRDGKAYVLYTVYELFLILRQNAQLFIDCGRNPERYAEALQQQMAC